MVRIVMLGAGSGFTHSLSGDIMQMEGIDGGEIRLVDIDAKRLRLAEGLVRTIAQRLGKDKAWTIKTATDRRRVLEGADFVTNTIEVSGVQTVRIDNDIPLEYGISQCIGDTIGPGGIFKAMRTVPVWVDVLRDIEQMAPNAYLLNYTNPMSIMTHAAMLVTNQPVVGLCHSVQGTSRLMADYCQVPYEELIWECAGLNHMAWFTRLEHKGEDLYPALKKRVGRDKKLWERDPVRFDFMLHFGWFVTESSGHFSEYIPYYRKRKTLRKTYCRPGYLGGDSFYANEWPTWRRKADEWRARLMAGEEEIKVGRSYEYASSIIQSIVTDKPFVFHGSTWNTGLIDNLPFNSVVEVPILVNKTGYNPCHFGPVPDPCAALNCQHMAVNKLTAEACVEGNREKAMHALMLDPLTSAVCSPAEIKEMFERMFKAERKFLRGF